MSAQIIPFPQRRPESDVDQALRRLGIVCRPLSASSANEQSPVLRRIEQIARNLGIDLDAPVGTPRRPRP